MTKPRKPETPAPLDSQPDTGSEMVRYDTACRAVAEAVSINEILQIRDQARALAACARVAKNHSMEANAVALRLRAVRRLDQLRQAQAETVGLNKGAAGGGKKAGPRGVLTTPRDLRPTLASQGIDKNLAKQAHTLGALSDEKFEEAVADAHDKVARAVRNAVREVEIEQERASYRAHTEQGCTIADLESLIGKIKFGVIAPDFPRPFETHSDKGKQRSAERHYATMSLDQTMAMAPLIRQLAADDCALFLWAVWSTHPYALKFIEACGFEYKGAGFSWVKTNPNAEVITLDGDGLHWGTGYATCANTEICLLATRGAPMRLANQVVIAPVGKHSEKPDEVHRRIERLYPGPRLDLFARCERKGWWTWGDEIERGQMDSGVPEPADDGLDIPECPTPYSEGKRLSDEQGQLSAVAAVSGVARPGTYEQL